MTMIDPYKVTNYIENTTVVNRAIMEIGGYAAPNVIMANNEVEARERAEKAALFFAFSLILPVACVPTLNKIFLKNHKIIDKFNGEGREIIQLSRKYLTKDADYMMEGINKLKESFKDKKDFKKIEAGIDNVLKRFPDKELLRSQLIKANAKILVSDILITGLAMGSIYWISNLITKLKTGRNGFSAEFKMADKELIEEKARKYKDKQKRNLLLSLGILSTTCLGTYFAFKKGMLSKNLGNKFDNLIKKHAKKFDYKDGKWMSRSTLLLIVLFGDIPSTLLSSRDKEELKYNAIKNTFFNSLFFGGDLLLNNIFARILDKNCKTKLVNTTNLPQNASWFKRMTCPVYSLKEISEQTHWDPKTLEKTKKFGVGMFWLNFMVILLTLGFGTPYLLNNMVRKNVENDMKNRKSKSNTQNISQ